MSKVFSAIKDIGLTLLIAVVIAVVLKFFIIDSCKILSGSMIPTLNVDDRILVSKISTHFKEPKRGDIIIFQPPEEVDEGVDFIKRVIGLPGETVEVKDGYVYINGKAIKEDYLAEQPNYTFGPVTVPEGQYLVLGDNRNNSADSHRWSYPFISKDDIDAYALFKYYPFNDIGKIDD